MQKRALAIVLVSGGLLLGAGGTAAANTVGPFTSHDGKGGKDWCELEIQSHPGASGCYEEPAGSGQWFFGQPS
jgi:hypothetical protein